MNEAWTWRPLGEVTIRGSNWNPRADPRPVIRYVDVSAVSRDKLRVVFDVEPLLGVTALESVGIEVDPMNQQLKRLPAVRLKGLS
ncbi:MAG: hypothetical protein OXE05_12510 [Chloroflexi bacterium]|nr:hypothetical protein [Chloroflexota bacterium]